MIAYNPLPTVQAFHESRARVRVLWGGLGTGKTSAGLWEFVLTAMENDIPLDGMVVRSSYRELRDTTLKTFMNWFGDCASWRESDSLALLRLPAASGSGMLEHVLRFRSLERPDDAKKVQSWEGAFVMLDEVVPAFSTSGRMCEGIPLEIVEYTNARLRQRFQGREPTRYTQVLVANPPPPSHWLYTHFLSKPAEELAARKGGVQVFFIKKDENEANLPKDYYAYLCDAFHDPDLVRRFVEGEIVAVYSGESVFPEAHDKTHVTSQRLKPVMGIPLVLGFDYGLCYDAETEVLTADGWKFFKDVDAHTDRVASRNPADGEMRYVPINFKTAQPYKGELLEWSSTEVNFCVTPEHRVPFTYRDSPSQVHFAPARWLAEHSAGHHYVDLTAVWKGTTTAVPAPFECAPEAFAAFLGIYLAEGCCDGKYKVSVAQNKSRPEIRAILDATGFSWRESWWQGAFRGWYTSNRALVEYLRRFGLAHDKYVPDEIRNAPPTSILAFIEAYTVGDGHVRRRANGAVEHTIYTVSARMAGDLQELALKVEWNSSCRGVTAQSSVIAEGNTLRTIQGSGGFNVTFKKRAQRAELLQRNFHRVPYDGTVYCLNVPWHTLYIRRGGKPSWNGNTPATLITQIIPTGQWRWLSEVQTFNRAFDTHLESLRAHMHDHYPGFEYRCWGDPSGETPVQTDERTCVEMAQAAGFTIKPGRQDWQSRREAMKQRLQRNASDGGPALLVSRAGCPIAAEALTGGYRYPKTASGEVGARPIKNSFSHLSDCAQYIATREFSIQPKAFHPEKYQLVRPPEPADPFRPLSARARRRGSWLAR